MPRIYCSISIALNLLLVLTITEQRSISPDTKKLFHDIVSGHGLYHGFDKLFELNGTNFKSAVFNESVSKIWIVEFYNSWCGHCQRFASVWKSLAANIFSWRDVVSLSAVDCALDDNNQLCRDFEIMEYPSIRFFPPKPNKTSLGSVFRKGSFDFMRQEIINRLKAIQNEGATSIGPNLKRYNGSTLEGMWTNIPQTTLYTLVVTEPDNSYLGSELALDFSRDNRIQVRSVSKDNTAIKNILGFDSEFGFHIVDRSLQASRLQTTQNSNRSILIKDVQDFFRNKGYNLTVDLPSTDIGGGSDADIDDILQIRQMEEDIKKKLNAKQLSSIVFQSDIEKALRYNLYNEIPMHKVLTGEKLDALKKYLNVLIKYFPIGNQGVKYLKRIRDEVVQNKTELDGKYLRDSAKNIEKELRPVFLNEDIWIGCRGSKAHFRGYPCGLWTLFHTLTVYAELKNRKEYLEPLSKGSEVLDAMHGYIKHFFTCTDCSNHFQSMASTISGNVTTYENAVMWLWAAHNNVNKRLAGDQTEDPEHKKVQFPTTEICPECRDGSGNFKPEKVLQFLQNMYTNISYLQIVDVVTTTTMKPIEPVQYSNSLRHINIGQDSGYQERTINLNKTKRLSWDFNIFDISLCVFLYICSVAILIVVCIKFVFKRNYRKKTYVYDILSKV